MCARLTECVRVCVRARAIVYARACVRRDVVRRAFPQDGKMTKRRKEGQTLHRKKQNSAPYPLAGTHCQRRTARSSRPDSPHPCRGAQPRACAQTRRPAESPPPPAPRLCGQVKHKDRADSVWIESFRFSPHSIYPFFAENRGVFEAIFRFADKPQILNVRFSYSSVVLRARFSIFTIGMLRPKSKLSIQTEFALRSVLRDKLPQGSCAMVSSVFAPCSRLGHKLGRIYTFRALTSTSVCADPAGKVLFQKQGKGEGTVSRRAGCTRTALRVRACMLSPYQVTGSMHAYRT